MTDVTTLNDLPTPASTDFVLTWRGIVPYRLALGQLLFKDASGNVGIGTASPNARLSCGALVGNKVLAVYDGGGAMYGFGIATDQFRIYAHTGAATLFGNYAVGTDTFTERMRLTGDGGLLLNSSTNLDAVSFLNFQVKGGIAIDTNTTSSVTAMSFFNGQGSGTRVGFIGTSGSSTSYNTSSDERLKENIDDADDSGPIIDAIKVRKFDWRINGVHEPFGCVTQELLPVYPQAVSLGASEDDMQAADYSKFVPLILKELQMLRARLALLEGANA